MNDLESNTFVCRLHHWTERDAAAIKDETENITKPSVIATLAALSAPKQRESLNPEPAATVQTLVSDDFTQHFSCQRHRESSCSRVQTFRF